MSSTATAFACPKGHASTEPDYCSECGARIQGKSPSATAASPAQPSSAGDSCPDCGTVREQSEIAFCEVCGYNFVSGAHGEIPVVPTPEAPLEEFARPTPDAPIATGAPAAHAQLWTAAVSVDPTLRGPESPEAPADVPSYELTLTEASSLIGRKDESRGIFPELSLQHDEAVSRRHAILQLDPQRGLLLRDIGASNGTRLNGQDLKPMVDYPLQNGDEITLGHWTRIRLQAK